ncbi:MAG: acyl-CoA dehydrogenase family protein [Geminicoccaceae bacterium]
MPAARRSAKIATGREAARLLAESAAKAYDRGERRDMGAGMAKDFDSEAVLENRHDAMRIHGTDSGSNEQRTSATTSTRRRIGQARTDPADHHRQAAVRPDPGVRSPPKQLLTSLVRFDKSLRCGELHG